MRVLCWKCHEKLQVNFKRCEVVWGKILPVSLYERYCLTIVLFICFFVNLSFFFLQKILSALSVGSHHGYFQTSIYRCLFAAEAFLSDISHQVCRYI